MDLTPTRIMCETCEFGEHTDYVTRKCQKNICKCKNGIAAGTNDNEICPTHNAIRCVGCNTGYYFDDSTDPENPICKIMGNCKCKNGTPNDFCVDKFNDNCKSCNLGYTPTQTEQVHINSNNLHHINSNVPQKVVLKTTTMYCKKDSVHMREFKGFMSMIQGYNSDTLITPANEANLFRGFTYACTFSAQCSYAC